MAHDLTKGSPLKNIIMMSFPMMLGYLFQQFYSLVDVIIVGRYVGADALAAVGSTTSITYFVMWFVCGMSGGFSVVLAQKFGCGDLKEVKRGVCLAFELSVLVTAVMTVICLCNMRRFLVLIHIPDEIMEEAYTYIFVIIAGMIAMVFYNVCADILRAIGDSKTPLYFLIISSILNIFLDILFINSFELGVLGAALATVVSQAVSGILCFVYMYLRFEEIRFSAPDWKMDLDRVKAMMSYGIPAGLDGATTALGILLLQVAINCYGVSTIAGYTAAIKVQNFAEIPLDAFAMTMISYEGQNYGAGRKDNMKAGYIKCSILGLIIAAVGGLCMFLFGSNFASLFVSGEDTKEIVDFAAKYLRFAGPFFLPFSILMVTRSSLQGMGDKLAPLLNGILETCFRAAFMFYLISNLNETMLCLVSPIIWTAAAIGLIARLIYWWSKLNQPSGTGLVVH